MSNLFRYAFSSKMSFEMAPKAPAVTWDELRKEVKITLKLNVIFQF